MEYNHAINVCLTGDAIKLSVIDQMADVANTELSRTAKAKRNALRAILKPMVNPLFKTRQRTHLFQIRPGGSFESIAINKKYSTETEIGYAFTFGDATRLSVAEGVFEIPNHNHEYILKKFRAFASKYKDDFSNEVVVNCEKVIAGVLKHFQGHQLKYFDDSRVFQLWAIPRIDDYEHGFNIIFNANKGDRVSA